MNKFPSLISGAITLFILLGGMILGLIVQQIKIRGQAQEIAALRDSLAEAARSQPEQAAFSTEATDKSGPSSSLLEPVTATQLGLAAGRGNINLVRMILDKHPELINQASGPFRATPLHNAAYEGRVQVVEELLARNADVHARNSRGFIPLHDAMTGGKPEIVFLLLDHHSDLNATNQFGQTPLGFGLAQDRAGLVEILGQHGAKE